MIDRFRARRKMAALVEKGGPAGLELDHTQLEEQGLLRITLADALPDAPIGTYTLMDVLVGQPGLSIVLGKWQNRDHGLHEMVDSSRFKITSAADLTNADLIDALIGYGDGSGYAYLWLLAGLNAAIEADGILDGDGNPWERHPAEIVSDCCRADIIRREVVEPRSWDPQENPWTCGSCYTEITGLGSVDWSDTDEDGDPFDLEREIEERKWKIADLVQARGLCERYGLKDAADLITPVIDELQDD